MIQFTLRCAQDHRFDSWFQSSEAFDKLSAAGMVACAVCGATDVEKAVMAPSVRASRSRATEPDHADGPADTSAGPLSGSLPGPLSGPANQARMLAEIRRHDEETSEYVGLNFVREARDMHDGLTPGRAIHGEARPEDARKLIEEGVPVTPLPFVPGRKTN